MTCSVLYLSSLNSTEFYLPWSIAYTVAERTMLLQIHIVYQWYEKIIFGSYFLYSDKTIFIEDEN